MVTDSEYRKWRIREMVREYRWSLKVRSYEGDAWGQVSASGILRYFEQSAIDAAADAGYGSQFHRERGTAWVIRRMTLLLLWPARNGDELEITTWISHFARVRGGREYRVANARTGEAVASGLAEWVYLDRQKMAPVALPRDLTEGFDAPGEPLGKYDSPKIGRLEEQLEFRLERTVEWHEVDSMGHVNNAIYADWLDDAMRVTMNEAGWKVDELRGKGLQLRGEYYNLDYKQGALPGDQIAIATKVEGITDRLCAVRQRITGADGVEVLSASSVYGWRTNAGEAAPGPQGWGEKGFVSNDEA